MTGKRFWKLVTFAGALLFIGGLVATIVLTIETGEERPDSECSTTTMRAGTLALTCFTSNDPKVLLGVGPLLLGIAMVGVGIWRWTAAASNEASLSSPDGVGGLFGSIRELQEQAMAMGTSAMSAGTTPPGGTPSAPPPAPGAPAPGTTPPSAPPSPPAPPAPPAPGE